MSNSEVFNALANEIEKHNPRLHISAQAVYIAVVARLGSEVSSGRMSKDNAEKFLYDIQECVNMIEAESIGI